jgi:5-methylcytosine-specific restriction endonuclease McrA
MKKLEYKIGRKKYMKEYYSKNRERLLVLMKKYRNENKEEIKPAKSRWYEKNKELAKNRAKIHYQKNKEHHHMLAYKYRIDNPEMSRLYTKVVLSNKRGNGKINIKILQMVYEDNVKKYGTLTCYLCLKQISFGDDSLDHKTPTSKGGLNTYDNLGIVHRKCNCIKFNKTYEEYLEYIKKINLIMEKT